MPHRERPDALVALTGKFKKEFLFLSSSESDCFLHIAQYPGCTSIDIQSEFNFDQPHVSRVLNKLIEKNYIRRLSDPKQSRQKIYFLTAKKGMRLLNECIDSCCEDLLSSSNLGLARIALALENSSLATLSSLKCLIENTIKLKQNGNLNCMVANDCNSIIMNSNQKVQRYHRLLSKAAIN